MQILEEVTALADKLSPSEKIRLVKHLAISLEDITFEKKKSEYKNPKKKTPTP